MKRLCHPAARGGGAGSLLLGHRDLAVNVAMTAMRMMQVPVHEVIHMVAVRHALVAATGGVDVRLRVRRAGVAWRALRGIRRAHRQGVLIHMPGMDVVQVPVVEVVHVAVVRDSEVATTRSVVVRVGGMLVMMRAAGGPEGAREQGKPVGDFHGIAFVGAGDASLHRRSHASGRFARAARRCSASHLQVDSLFAQEDMGSIAAS